MSGRKAGPRHRGRRIPPALALVLGLAFVPLTAAGQPVPPRCEGLEPGPAYCIGIEQLRIADAEHAVAVECPVQLRVAEQRLVVALGDAAVQARALQAQSELVVNLRGELARARPWLPGWAWWLIGAGVGVAGSVSLALAL